MTGIVIILGVSLGIIHLVYRAKAPVKKNPKLTPHAGQTLNITSPEPGWWESRRLIYFGIPARIFFRYEGRNPGRIRTIMRSAWSEFDRIGNIFNPYDESSRISMINRAPKPGRVIVSADVCNLVKISRRLWRKSSGAFDPTMFPVKQLWQDAVKKQAVPGPVEISAALSSTGFGHVKYDCKKRALFFDRAGIHFDFGGIAKGYAVDRIRVLLQQKGITSGLVQLGGEISAFGEHDGRPWRIGVQDPKDMQALWGVISKKGDLRVSTSGNYRQPLIIDGVPFYHIFSPKTGRPVSDHVLGVTTVSLDAKVSNALLDGAATAITVLGARAGLDFAEKMGIAAIILTEAKDGRIIETRSSCLSDVYSHGD